MNKTNTITVRIPEELKLRIEKISKKQGVSMNQFAMYALTKEQTSGLKTTLKVKIEKSSMKVLVKLLR